MTAESKLLSEIKKASKAKKGQTGQAPTESKEAPKEQKTEAQTAEVEALKIENDALLSALEELQKGSVSPAELAKLKTKAENAERELGSLQFATEEHVKTLTNRIAELEIKAKNAGSTRKDRILESMREAVAAKIADLHRTYENGEGESVLIDALTLKISVFRKLCSMRDKYRENIQTCNKFLESSEDAGTLSFGYNRDLRIHSPEFIIAMTNAYNAGAIECIEKLDAEIVTFKFN